MERALGIGACATSWTGWISGSWILLLVFIVGLLMWVARRSSRQMSKAMTAQDVALSEQQRAIGLTERALAISEDSNRLLSEILEELRTSRRP